MYPPDDEPGFWRRHGRAVLWGGALAFFGIGLLVSLLTPYKLFLLFLPIVFTPALFRGRHGGEDDPR